MYVYIHIDIDIYTFTYMYIYIYVRTGNQGQERCTQFSRQNRHDCAQKNGLACQQQVCDTYIYTHIYINICSYIYVYT